METILGVCFVIAIAVLVYRFWRAAINANLAYKLGRKVRRMGISTGHAAVDAAHTAGRATGKAENVAAVVGRSFREGRDSTKHTDSDPEGGA